MKSLKAIIPTAAIALTLGFSLLSPHAVAATIYTVKDLGTLGGSRTVAMGINNAGQVVGSSYTTSNDFEHAFMTGANGTGMTDLGTLTGTDSYATAINDRGQVAGNFYSPTNYGHAFVTGPKGQKMRDLGTLGGSASYARAINAVGQVVGDAKTAGDVTSHAFITGADGAGMKDLGTMNGGNTSYAKGINDAGQVIGFSGLADGDGMPVEGALFVTGPNGQGMRDIGLHGPMVRGEAINADGRVVGVSDAGEAFITGPGAKDFAFLHGVQSVVYGINALGQVVGTDGYAFVTGPNGEDKVDLNYLVEWLPSNVYLVEARGVNDLGQIIANGSDMHAYLLSPVPEADADLLAVAGLGLLACLKRRGPKNAFVTPL